MIDSAEATTADVRHAPEMTTTPERANPQPRDIALELETPEQAADLEAQSDAEEPSEGS